MREIDREGLSARVDSRARADGLSDRGADVRTAGLEPDDGLLQRMVARYEELLPSSLPLKHGHVLPNVREILEAAARADGRPLVSADRQHARRRPAKLTHYGLFTYFFPTARSPRITGVRATIAARALALARRDGPCRRRADLRDRRHAARHRVRQRHRARARSRWRPAVIQSRSCSRIDPGGYSSSSRRPTEFLELIGVDAALTPDGTTAGPANEKASARG